MKIIIEADSIEELKTILERFTEKPTVKMISLINGLPLSTRAKCILAAEGIETVEQLMNLSDWELLKMPNLGRTTLKEIRDALTNMVKQ